MIRKTKNILFLATSFILLFFLTPKEAKAASLSLSPATKNVIIGETFTVSVMLDTQGELTSGTDAIILYDAAKLSVVSAVLGDLYTNKVQEDSSTTGKVTFRATAPSGSPFNGSGVLATVQFKAIADGNANVSFDFTLGSTVDSNVGKQGTEGEDILTSATGATYTIGQSSGGDSGVPGVGGGESTGSGTTTTPVAGFITPTILLAGLGLLLLFLPLFI